LLIVALHKYTYKDCKLQKGFTTEGDEIKWNFTKFLIDKEGKIVERFAPTYEPEKIQEKIEELLK
jgi:glutathione peroxidase